MRVEMIEYDESDLLKSEACCSVWAYAMYAREN